MKGQHHIAFYTKRGCCLCDEARDLLYHLREGFSFTLQEIDIMTDSALYEQYKTMVPVVVIDGRWTLGARIEEEDLRRYLQGEPGESHE